MSRWGLAAAARCAGFSACWPAGCLADRLGSSGDGSSGSKGQRRRQSPFSYRYGVLWWWLTGYPASSDEGTLHRITSRTSNPCIHHTEVASCTVLIQ